MAFSCVPDLGHTLRTLREERSLSRASFARLTGLTVEMLDSFEAGEQRMSAQILYNVANRLGIRLSTLFGAAGAMPGTTAPTLSIMVH